VPVVVLDHPLAAHRLAALRDEATPPERFRSALRQLSGLLVYEATRALPTAACTVHTPLADAPAARIDRWPLLVPVLRAGLGMLDAALELLPDSPVAFVGLRRDEESLRPDVYLQAVPSDLAGRPALVLDPMAATGGSLVHTVELLGRLGAGSVTALCVLAAPEGVAALEAAAPDVVLYTAALDERLNDVGFIVPGLGDAGDRQFGAY